MEKETPYKNDGFRRMTSHMTLSSASKLGVSIVEYDWQHSFPGFVQLQSCILEEDYAYKNDVIQYKWTMIGQYKYQ